MDLPRRSIFNGFIARKVFSNDHDFISSLAEGYRCLEASHSRTKVFICISHIQIRNGGKDRGDTQ